MNERPNTAYSTAEMAREAEAKNSGQQGRLSTKDVADAANRPAPAPNTAANPQPQQATPLFPTDEEQKFRSRWESIQTGFVDDPRHSVEQADNLVAEVIKNLAETFANERSKLEQQWSQGNNVSTEDLRLGLQHYRSFFDRLLSV